jgi:selenocysteine lyase/cysteine desulfurase
MVKPPETIRPSRLEGHCLRRTAVDRLREAYARLDAAEHIYLDYTGGSLYAESQLRQHHELLRSHVFGNPHSSNPASIDATRFVEGARQHVLSFFKADPAEYEVIFTQNASGALKLVGESYPFGPGSRYLLTFDNHNSVNGIREFPPRGAMTRSVVTGYIRVGPPRIPARSIFGQASSPIAQSISHP